MAVFASTAVGDVDEGEPERRRVQPVRTEARSEEPSPLAGRAHVHLDVGGRARASAHGIELDAELARLLGAEHRFEGCPDNRGVVEVEQGREAGCRLLDASTSADDGQPGRRRSEQVVVPGAPVAALL